MKTKMNMKLLGFTLIFSGLCAGYFPEPTDAQTPAARVNDNQTCPLVCVIGLAVLPHIGGPISNGSSTVIICSMPAARVTDPALCQGCGINTVIANGSATVLINGLPAARLGDGTSHGGAVTAGCPTVIIGG